MDVPGSLPQVDIRGAFLRIPDADLATLLAGLSPHESVNALVSHPDADVICTAVADWMLRHPSVCLGAVLPGLWTVRDEAIDTSALPGRVGTALARLVVTVWGEVMEWTPSLLCDIEGFGEGTARDFLAAAARVAALACIDKRPPSTPPLLNSFEPRRFPPSPGFQVSQLRALGDWAVNEAGATTIGQFIAACSQTNLPDDIAHLAASLRDVPLHLLMPVATRSARLEILVSDLAGVLDHRTKPIFFGRMSYHRLRTLEDLAGELGVTKERVRQLSIRAEERVREALATPRFAPIGWRAHALRCALGAAAPPDSQHYTSVTSSFLNGVPEPDRERVHDLLLWLAGPYRRDASTGWICTGEMPDSEVVAEFSDDRGRVDLERLLEKLSSCGLLPAVHSDWVERIGRIKRVDGNWLVWTGTVTDKAVRILEAWGRPATPEEIVNAIGEGHDIRATRSRMFEDERVMRVDMSRVGLRAWGLEEFSTIAEEIDQELERLGGTADLDDLVTTLVDRFGLREGSVRLYANAVMFVVQDGVIRRRTSADPLPAVPPISEVPGCYLSAPDTLIWRLPISADTLRGSGRLLPSPIGAWLGVVPGGEVTLAGAGGSVRVTWPDTSANGPSIGSIRFLAEAAGGRQGDQGLLCFSRDAKTISLTLVDQTAVAAKSGFGRLSLLTGIPHPDGDETFLHELAAALGVRGTRAAVSAEFKRRGEPDLAELVPPEEASPDLDAAIESLKDLF